MNLWPGLKRSVGFITMWLTGYCEREKDHYDTPTVLFRDFVFSQEFAADIQCDYKKELVQQQSIHENKWI